MAPAGSSAIEVFHPKEEGRYPRYARDAGWVSPAPSPVNCRNTGGMRRYLALGCTVLVLISPTGSPSYYQMFHRDLSS